MSARFREMLRTELVKRSKRNPSYSLRAFAASMDMDASTFSKILKGKRAIGKKTIQHIGKKLGLNSSEIQKYLQPAPEPDYDDSNDRYLVLAADKFAIISDWHHFAIRSLISVKGFKPDRKWVAKVLDLPVKEVDLALERLLRIGLITIDKNGQWKSTGSLSNLGKSQSHDRFYRQHLEKAVASLEGVPADLVNNSAMTFTMDLSRMTEACNRIVRFRRSLANFLAEGENCDEVYSLTISLFPISHIYKTKDASGKK